MFELHQVGENTWYIEAPAKIGLYVDAPAVWLIDAGNDKDAGRKVKKILDAQGWTLSGIVCTHSNADHIGGCQYLQNQYHCPVFARGIEAAFTEYPVLEPSFLYGGYPCAPLRHKFLMAKGCTVTPFDSERFPKCLEVIDLPGHFFDMVGLRTPDDIVFLADCLSSETTLEKYGIPFIYDVKAYLTTLEKIQTLSAALFVPSHAPCTKDIIPLAQLNIAKVNEIAEQIQVMCATPVSFETILANLFELYGLVMNFEQYVLVGSTVRSFLSWLQDAGKLNAYFERNRLLYVH